MDYKSSLAEFDRFLGSHVYDDMLADFESWLDGALGKMENADTTVEVYRCQGRIQVMRSVLQWFDNFRSILEDLQNDR